MRDSRLLVKRKGLLLKSGQGLTEYALIVALVVSVAIVIFSDTGLKNAILALYGKLATVINGVM